MATTANSGGCTIQDLSGTVMECNGGGEGGADGNPDYIQAISVLEPPAIILPSEAEATVRALWEANVEHLSRHVISNSESVDCQAVTGA